MEMIDYITRIPQKLKENKEATEKDCSLIAEFITNKNIDQIVLVASGSSYNASLIASSFMESEMQIPVKVISSEEVKFIRFNVYNNPLFVIISQGGYSTNSINAAKEILQTKYEVIILTSNIKSDIAFLSDKVFDFMHEVETVKYVTLGVPSLAIFLAEIALFVSAIKFKKSSKEFFKQVDLLSNQYGSSIELARDFYIHHSEDLRMMDKTFICGSNVSIGAAREGALKLQETAHIPVLNYEFEEFLHGPNMQLTPKYNIFMIDDYYPSYKQKFIFETLSKDISTTYIITNNKFENLNSLAIPRCSIPLLHGLLSLPVFQIIGYHLNRIRKDNKYEYIVENMRRSLPIKSNK